MPTEPRFWFDFCAKHRGYHLQDDGDPDSKVHGLLVSDDYPEQADALVALLNARDAEVAALVAFMEHKLSCALRPSFDDRCAAGCGWDRDWHRYAERKGRAFDHAFVEPEKTCTCGLADALAPFTKEAGQ